MNKTAKKSSFKLGKKGFEFTLVNLLLLIGTVIVIGAAGSLIAKETSKIADESVCRASVFARENLNFDAKIKTIGTPLLCATKDKKLSGDDSEITKELARLIARCWWQFGQGTVRDPFKEGTVGGDRECMVCYTVSFKNQNYKISSEKLLQYLAETNYLVGEDDKGVSYLDYVQSYGNGTGNILLTDISAPEVYAISYADTTKECGLWCGVFGGIGAVGGAAGGAVIGAKVAAVTCVAGGAVTAGITTLASPVCVMSGAAIGAIAGGLFEGAVYTAATAELSDILSADRSVPTIYVTRLQDITEDNICNVHKV